MILVLIRTLWLLLRVRISSSRLLLLAGTPGTLWWGLSLSVEIRGSRDILYISIVISDQTTNGI